jgi:O-antigen/teichoic acid export membrane protein
MVSTSLLGQAITWFITIFVARMLTPEDYGLVALSGLFTVFANIVCQMGLGAAVIQSESVTENEQQSLYCFSLLMGICMLIIGWTVAAPLMTMLFDEPKLTGLVRFSSLVFLFSSAKSMPRNLMIKNMQFDKIAKIEMFSRILTSITVLIAVIQGAGVWALAAQWVLFELFLFLFFFFAVPIIPQFKSSFSDIKPLLIFGMHLMIRMILTQFYSMCDSAIIGKLGSQSFLGGYNFAKQLTNIPFDKIIGLINRVLFPYFSQNKNELEKLRQWTILSAQLQILLVLPFFIFLFYCANEAVTILLGANWLIAVFPLKVLCVANVFRIAESYNTNLLTALGKTYEQVKYVIAMSIAIILGMLGINAIFGITNSIFVWVVFYPALTFVLSSYTLKMINLRAIVLLKEIRTILFSIAILLIGLQVMDLLVTGPVWFTLVIKIVTGVTLYCSTLAITDLKRTKELVGMIFQ